MSRYPYFDYFKEILEDIMDAVSSPLQYPIESIINNLIMKVPAPVGMVNMIYNKQNGKQLILR